MPELPEVETIRRGLDKFITGQKIHKVRVLCDKSFQGPHQLAENTKIQSIRRRGKALLIDLENHITLLIHLRMTGQLIYRAHGTEDGQHLQEMIKSGNFQNRLADQSTFAGGHPTDSFFTELPNKQTRVIFDLGDGALFFNDQRKFGFVKPLVTDEVEQDKFIASLAPEPWDADPSVFYQKLQRRKNSPIKAVILDQKVIAGIGNIYADEALFASRIHPATLAGDLTPNQATELLQNASAVMQESIASGGSTMATYVRADGSKGNYLELFAKVFRREGQPCPECGREIEKIRVAGRGTHICPHCQRRPLL